MANRDHHKRDVPPTSQQIAEAWQPLIATSIELFSAGGSGYAVLWNAFKRTASGSKMAEKTALSSGTASRVYRI